MLNLRCRYWKPFFNEIPCSKHYWSELKCKVDLSWPGIKNTRFKVWNKRKCLKDADSFALQLLHFTFYGRDNFACYVGQSLWLVGYSFFFAIQHIITCGHTVCRIQFAGVYGTLFLSLYDLITQLCTPTRLVSLQIQTYSFDWIKWAIWLAHKIFYSIEGMVNIPFPAGVRTGVVYVYASYVVQMALNLIIFLFYRYRFIIKLKAWNMSSTWN